MFKQNQIQNKIYISIKFKKAIFANIYNIKFKIFFKIINLLFLDKNTIKLILNNIKFR